MGILSILLGIVAFFGFTAGGAVLASTINSIMKNMSNTFVTMSNVSSTTISIVVIAAGAFIGLLVGLNLIMHGLTFRSNARYGQNSVRYICFSIGVIDLCASPLTGLFASKAIAERKDLLSLFGLMRSTPDIMIYLVVAGFFTFIGILVFMNMTMHGLTYSKVAKLRRKG